MWDRGAVLALARSCVDTDLEARRTPNFRTAFRCVWTSRMAPAVRERVDAALAAYGGNL